MGWDDIYMCMCVMRKVVERHGVTEKESTRLVDL